VLAARYDSLRTRDECIKANIECRIEDSGSCTTPQVSRGAGLSMVHELTKEMGGALEQTFGLKGSVSKIILPRASIEDVQFAQHHAEQLLEPRV
jgi:hypothetical protein